MKFQGSIVIQMMPIQNWKKREEKPPRRQEYGLKKILLIVVRVNELHTASKTK